MKKDFPLLALFTAIIFSCCSGPGYAPGGTSFVYRSLHDLKYDAADLKSGTAVNILGFSSGQRQTKDTVFYSQFLVIDNTSGDTIRILTPMISIDNPAPDTTLTYTMPMQYDMDKGVRNASFEPMDSTKNRVLNIQGNFSDGTMNNANKTGDEAFKADSSRVSLVIYDPGIPQFEKNYKMAIGVLRFKDQPW
jgi:hypothetical protein